MPKVEIEARGLSLHYEIKGEGPRLLVLLGSGSDLRHQPNIFDTPLTSHFEVLAFDQRGQGQSDAPDVPYSMADYADDAKALVEAVGWERCHVLGISFGGMVAQELALRHPEVVERLILACTSSGGEGGASYPIHEVEASDARARAAAFLPLFDVRHEKEYTKLAPRPKAGKRRLVKQLEALVARAAEPARLVGTVRQLEARLGHDTYERLPQITQPALVCGGRFDAIAPPVNQWRMAEALPHGHLAMFDGGHLFFQEDPAAFGRFVDFLLDREAPKARLQERGMQLYLADRFEEAKEAFAALLEQEGCGTEAMFYLGECHRIDDDENDKAIDWWKKAVEAEPESLFGMLSQSQLHVYRDYERGTAQTYLNDVIARHPGSPLGHNYLADIYFAWANYSSCEEELGRAIALDPGDVISFQNRASCRLAQGNLDDALADANEVIRQTPYYVQAYIGRGEIYEKMGRVDDALASYGEALSLSPLDECALVQRGLLYAKDQRWEEAMTDFDKAIQKDPNDANAYAGRGEAFLRQGLFDKAIDDLGKAIDHNADNLWDCYSHRGFAHHQKGELDEAIRDYSEALYRRYEAVEALTNRGFAYQEKGMLDNAFNDFCDAVGRSPEDPFALNNRGAMYLYRNDPNQAITDFTAAIGHNDKEPDFFYNRACAREETGDFIGAVEDLKQYLALNGAQQSGEKAEIQERIDALLHRR